MAAAGGCERDIREIRCGARAEDQRADKASIKGTAAKKNLSGTVLIADLDTTFLFFNDFQVV